jgi:hypothetical protein
MRSNVVVALAHVVGHGLAPRLAVAHEDPRRHEQEARQQAAAAKALVGRQLVQHARLEHERHGDDGVAHVDGRGALAVDGDRVAAPALEQRVEVVLALRVEAAGDRHDLGALAAGDQEAPVVVAQQHRQRLVGRVGADQARPGGDLDLLVRDRQALGLGEQPRVVRVLAGLLLRLVQLLLDDALLGQGAGKVGLQLLQELLLHVEDRPRGGVGHRGLAGARGGGGGDPEVRLLLPPLPRRDLEASTDGEAGGRQAEGRRHLHRHLRLLGERDGEVRSTPRHF